MDPYPIDDEGRWWHVAGIDVDLLGEPDPSQPRNSRAAVLAFRDGKTPEERDLAALLLWQLEEHPGVNGGCATCGTTGECPVQWESFNLAHFWLFIEEGKRYRVVSSPQWQARLRALEAKASEHQS